MKTIKVSEATNTQLDWLVAKCEGHRVGIYNTGEVYLIDTPWKNKNTIKWIAVFRPSSAWSQMGPIIERERISIRFWDNTQVVHTYMPNSGAEWSEGPTALIAAARCYVVSRVGEFTEVPDELT